MEGTGITTQKIKNKLVIQIDQSARVQNIASVHGELQKLKYDKPVIEVEIGKNTDIDLSFIQILVSLKQSILTNEQKITLKGPLTEIQKNVILGSLKDIKIAT